MTPPDPPDLPLPAELGETIGAYRLTRVIGRGGMGCVYEGTHETLGRAAAIKIIHPWLSTDESYTERLKQEARIVSELRHPNVVEIVDFLRTDPPVRLACVMELLEGPTLAQLLEGGRLRPVQALNLAAQICDALAAVHGRGVVHRDIKPSNIGVVAPLDTNFQRVPCAKLLDFGIAKVADPTATSQTAGATQVGTSLYMAPEQIAAESVSSATDVYALAEVLAEMLTGRRIFSGGGLDMMRYRVVGPAPKPELPDDLVGRPAVTALISAALSVDPLERPWLSELSPRLRALAQRQPDDRME